MSKFIRQFWEILVPYKRKLLMLLAVIAFDEVVRLLPPYFFKNVIDTLTSTPGDLVVVILFAAATFGAEMTIISIDLYNDRKILQMLFWLEHYLPTKTQEKLLELSLGYHEREQTGEKITRLERGTEKLVEFTGHLLWSMFPLTIQTIGTVVVLMAINWQTAVVFALAIPIFVTLTWKLHVATHPLRMRQEDLYESSSGKLGESIINIKTVQAFAQERREQNIYRALRQSITDLGNARLKLETRVKFYRSLVVNSARFGIISMTSYFVYAGHMSIGDVVLFLTLSEKVYISLFSLQQILDRMVDATEPVQRVFELIHTNTTVPVATNPIQPTAWKGRVEFRNVSFGYAPGQLTISNVSFTINPGETVAFAGLSGGGKSTIVKLFFRYYDVTSGQILIDGQPLPQLDLGLFRAHTGYVPQETEIMSGTIMENITYGKPDTPQEEVLRIARLTRVDDFVRQFPNGYQTLVGERGIKLSGGQRQRVGIARALLTNPAFLVFDEATSNLDAETEGAIQDAFHEITGTRTVLIIAHRLSTIMNADKIIVIDKGQVAEVGTHEQLIKQNGLYGRLVKLQMEGKL